MADDSVKCSSCKEQSPQLKCYCMEIPISLCAACSVVHFLADTELLHRPFPVEHQVSEQELCEVCRISTAQSICTCMFPWISYCSDCAAVHVSSEIGHVKHTLEPLYAKYFLQSSASLPAYYERQHFVEAIQAELLRNTTRVETCLSEVSKVAQDLITSIEGWRDNTLRGLQKVRDTIKENVEHCCTQLETLRYQLRINPQMRLDQLIQNGTRENLEGTKQELTMLQFSVDVDRIFSQVPYVLKYAENYLMLEAVDKLYYAMPKTNKLVNFDLPDMAPSELLLESDYKFKSFSAWCKLPSGELFLSGGLLQRNGTTYYKEALLIDPTTKKLKPVPSMFKERCRHGTIYYKDFVYVFGGYCDEYLTLCERFSLKDQTWQQLPELKDGKDCVTAAVWKDRIYLVGYASNKIEVYDVSTDSMFVMPVTLRLSLMNLLIPKHCALVSIENGEMTVVMESEIIKVNIEGQTVRSVKLPVKIERAWYSQCPPAVLRGEIVYFFTLEQELWKLNLASSDLKFVHKLK